ncbi:MAG: hypothetical protein LBN11_08525 [Tannerella sp.]|jgi:uncharacterized membrane protein YozB (DUF420 family)|nr:hypothetical protein [Tannerella sp.]
MEKFITSFGLPLAYIALALAAIGTIAFPLFFMLKDIKKAKHALLRTGALIVVFLLCYILADGEATENFTAGQMKIINTGLYAVYATALCAVLAIIYLSVSRLFK